MRAIHTLSAVVVTLGCLWATDDPVPTPPGGVPDGTEYSVRQLLVRNHDVVLAGELLMPHATGPVPGVLLITGSGPHTREQTISGSPMFRMIADYLVSQGIAAFLVDARAYGLSSGSEDFTTADRATDARACLDRLRAQPGIDPSRVGVLGHSEGAMIALMLASEAHAPSFVVLLGAPGVPCGELWVDQATAGLARRNVDATTIAKVRAAFLKAVDKAARGFASDDEFYDAGREVLLAHGMAPEDVKHEVVDSVMSDLRTPWYRYFLGWDPGTYVSRVESPLLAVWGERDQEVGAAKNAALFETEKQSRPDADFTVQVLPGEDHFFLRNPAGEAPAKHEYGRMHVSPVLLETIATWIRSHTGPATSAK